MAGHSKWANIKQRKGAQDAKRGKIFQKLAREIVIAAKKGGDPNNNPSLRLVMAKARSSNMPKDRVQAAIIKGLGTSKNDNDFQELIYEANGPAGSFMIIESATDKPSRTGPHLKSILKKYGWSISPPNSAMYAFQRKGRIIIDKELISIEKMEEVVLDTCASDFQIEEEVYLIYSEPNKLNTLQEELEKHNLNEHLEIGVGFFPSVTINLNEKHLESLEKLIDLLEDEEDILSIFHNVDKMH